MGIFQAGWTGMRRGRRSAAVNPPPHASQSACRVPICVGVSSVWARFLPSPKGIFAVQHKFFVGQTVILMPRVLQAAVPGAYEVLRLMPESDRDAGDPMYRIKS